MRTFIVLVIILMSTYRLGAVDDGSGPSQRLGTDPHQSGFSPAAARAAAIQKQLEGIETELAILRAAVRDPQTSDAVRSAVIDQQEDLLERRKELESELRIHLVNLENARSDPNGPSSSGRDRREDDDEEV